MQLRGTHDYRFFEFYYLDKDTFQFKMKGDLELYVNKLILGHGHFHEVSEALQRREFIKDIKNGKLLYT